MKNNENGKIFDDKGRLLYEGELLNGKPCGVGIEYYENGIKYREGRFYIKGLIKGREYYPNGVLRFEGSYRLNTAYGPNYPVEGRFYNENGELIYSGKPEYHFGGVGYPILIKPEGFGSLGHPSGHKTVYMMWEDKP